MNTSSESRVIDPVSFELRRMIEIVVIFALCTLFYGFGIVSNIANIIVFVKQGFKDSVNVSLLGLAVADLSSVTTQFWTSFCRNPLLDNPDIVCCDFHVMYYTTMWTHVCFNRITSFITAFITLERCLCISLPLKIKSILNPFKTKIIIILIFIVMFIVFSPFYYVNRLEWQYNPSLNRTLPVLTYTDDRVLVETVTFLIHSVGMSSISLISVLVCTIILIVQLQQRTQWREMSTAITTSETKPTVRDSKVIKMVTVIAVTFIICFLPATINFFLMAYIPEFSVTGQYQNLFISIWGMTILVESVNSGINIFIYFNMSSKYKETFTKMFCRCHQ